ncbi:MAG: NACHT domain-containing protein [Gammaproteobacteria bacterium]|nr:NACHT domain-containing protein [Gammaproteobacteria bacterium]
MTDTTNAGGDAAAAGFEFQTALGGIAYVHVLLGTPVAWTKDWTASPPTAVAFETGGPGDDLRLELADNRIVEVQAKKRLTATQRFWSALHALCQGIATDRCDYAVLAVDPLSSKPVKDDYARALRRLGTGSPALPTKAQTELAKRLDDAGHDITVCSRLRIKTVSALPDIADAVNVARTELARLCADPRQEPAAWHALCRDAMAATANRERRTLSDLLSVLRAANVDLPTTSTASPAQLAHAIQAWTLSRTEHFHVLGMPRLLPTDQAWIPLRAFVRDSRSPDHASVEEALAAYHAVDDEPTRTTDQIDARTIGTFRNLCVIVGGPGSGKSLLLDVLARDFAKESLPTLRVNLRDLATRVATTGCTVEEGLLDLGLAGSGIPPQQFRAATLQEPVVLCDGLDECDDQQSTIASLRQLTASHPTYRIIVTTRPFGYITSELASWRHYEITALVENDVSKHLQTLCHAALEPGDPRLDSLRPRIDAYLAGSNVTATLARAPLLLGFAASLFLRSEQPTRSKSELYARIFRMIDQTGAPGGRAPADPPRAVRNAILNHLGWLSVTSPLCPASEIESRCADRLVSMGAKPIDAPADVERSIDHWNHVGLVERLRHADVDLLAFVHKTCGEFAAARYLAGVGTDSARKIIRTELASPDSLELLDFATQTPLATTMAEMLIAEFQAPSPDPAVLDRLFPVIARPETSLSPTARTALLQRVFDLAMSVDRRKAYAAGARLARSDLRRFPEAAPMAQRLLDAPAEWSRLVGWAVLARHFPERLDLDGLDEAFHRFVDRSRDDGFFVFKKRTVFGPLRDRAVFEEFLLGASRQLLSTGDHARQDRTIAAVRDIREQLTGHFVSRFEPLLREFGRGDAAERNPSKWGRLFDPVAPLLVPEEWYEQTASVLREVVSGAFLDGTAESPPDTGLKFLSAFINMAGVLKAVADDVYAWRSANVPLADVHVLLRDAASVFGLPTERLAAEAKRAIELIGPTVGSDGQTSALRVFPRVDPPEIDWTRARGVATDIRLLERLVHHPSSWMGLLAAQLLDERLSPSERAPVCARILASGSGDALHWGAALALELPNAQGCELVLRRLEGSPAEGLHQLFALLADELPELNPAHRPVLEHGLFRCGSMTAAAAARWCRAAGGPNDAWLPPLLRRALRHWLSRDDDPGPVYHPPGSPRDALLHALCDLGDPDPAELADLCAHSRHDVARAAVECLVRHAGQSTPGRAELARMLVDRRFAPELCDQLIGHEIPFDANELAALAAMSNDPDPRYRALALRRVFTHPRMDRKAAETVARSMTNDRTANVRDAAYRFLDSSPTPP